MWWCWVGGSGVPGLAASEAAAEGFWRWFRRVAAGVASLAAVLRHLGGEEAGAAAPDLWTLLRRDMGCLGVRFCDHHGS